MSLQVAVIYGGRSGEHEVSLRSAEAVIAALDPERYQVRRFFISKEGRWEPKPIMPEPGANGAIDVVIPMVHGTFGEDGTLQGLLELADLPYVGADVLASATCMDKEVAKRLLAEAGLPVVDYYVAETGDCSENPFGFPVFVKPANMGSSVGISKASNCMELRAAVSLARQYDPKVIVEAAVIGQELECAVMGNQEPVASTPCEILPSRAFYDYEDKYLLNEAQVKMPADLPPSEIETLRGIAIAAYEATGCEGMARVDFLREEATGKLMINEINTIPGFTSISMYPKMWEYDGVSMSVLLDRLIALALERYGSRRSLKFTR